MFIAMMGADGLTEATQVAILNANYIAARLSPYSSRFFTRDATAGSRTSAFLTFANGNIGRAY